MSQRSVYGNTAARRYKRVDYGRAKYADANTKPLAPGATLGSPRCQQFANARPRTTL